MKWICKRTASITAGIVGLLLESSAIHGTGSELQFIDGSELRKLYIYDGIPTAFGERVLVFPEGGPPDAVSFAYCEPYDSLKDLISKHYQGAASIHEVTMDSQLKESEYGEQSYRQLVSRESEKLRAAGFRTDRYSALEIVFPKYNIINKGDQSSSLVMRLVNGHDIFGTPNSLLTLIRRDNTLEQLRTFHFGIPLAIKERSDVRIVTNTETKMIQELESSIQKKSIDSILTITNGDPYASFDSLVKFRKALDRCN